MATNIKTVMTYPLNGSTTDFNIPFEYLARKFVQVTLIGVDRKVLVLNQEYRFATKAIISTTRAWGPADGYQQIEIRRYTSATERLVDFTDGSILRAYDLNISQIQTLHVAEEARDLTADTIGVNNDGNLDARGRRIVNLADGVDDGDAISVGQVKRMNQNSWQARNEAQGFRNEAQGFRNEAEGFRNQAATSKQAAATSESQSWNHSERSRTFAEASQGSANSAGQSATNASNSAGSAKTSENNSASSASASAWSAVTARNEADRAKVEADKLGNMNDFAGTIESVDVETSKITFKGALDARHVLISGNAWLHDTNVDGNLNVDRSVLVGGNSWLHDTNVDGNLNVSRDVLVSGQSGLVKLVDGGRRRLRNFLDDNGLTGYIQLINNATLTSPDVVRAQISMTASNKFDISGDTTVRGNLTSYTMAPANPSIGTYINTTAVRAKLIGRGGHAEPDGAVGGFYLQEQVGTNHRIILNINGFGNDTNWQFHGGGKIGTPYGEVQTSGSDIRIKDEVYPATEGAGERIDEIGLVEYTEIGTGRRRRGWIAQQVDTVDPLYAYISDGLLNTDDRAILADLIATVQGLRQRVAELEANKE